MYKNTNLQTQEFCNQNKKQSHYGRNQRSLSNQCLEVVKYKPMTTKNNFYSNLCLFWAQHQQHNEKKVRFFRLENANCSWF